MKHLRHLTDDLTHVMHVTHLKHLKTCWVVVIKFGPVMSRDRVRSLLAARLRAWQARDTEALAATYAIDATVTSPIFSTLEGRAAIKQSFDALFRSFPDWQHVIEEAPIVGDDDRVVQLFRARATHRGDFMGLPGSGKRFEITGVQIFSVNAEPLVVSERRIYDFTGLLIQLGVLRGRLGR